MKKTDELQNLRKKTVKELTLLRKQKLIELNKLRIQASFGKDKKLSEFGKIKNTIARIKTIINEMVLSKPENKDLK